MRTENLHWEKGCIRTQPKITIKMTNESHKVIPEDIDALRSIGFSDDVILEGIHVIAFFNYLDRMADATGAPVENLQEMMANMT